MNVLLAFVLVVIDSRAVEAHPPRAERPCHFGERREPAATQNSRIGQMLRPGGGHPSLAAIYGNDDREWPRGLPSFNAT